MHLRGSKAIAFCRLVCRQLITHMQTHRHTDTQTRKHARAHQRTHTDASPSSWRGLLVCYCTSPTPHPSIHPQIDATRFKRLTCLPTFTVYVMRTVSLDSALSAADVITVLIEDMLFGELSVVIGDQRLVLQSVQSELAPPSTTTTTTTTTSSSESRASTGLSSSPAESTSAAPTTTDVPGTISSSRYVFVAGFWVEVASTF